MLKEHSRGAQHRNVVARLQEMSLDELQNEDWKFNINRDNQIYAATMVST